MVARSGGGKSTNAEETKEPKGIEGRVQGEPKVENLFETKEVERGEEERRGGSFVRGSIGSEEGKPKSGGWGGGWRSFQPWLRW